MLKNHKFNTLEDYINDGNKNNKNLTNEEIKNIKGSINNNH